MASTLTVAGMAAGLNGGQITLGPSTISNTVAVGELIFQALASGDNTFTVPTGAVACVIWGPSNSAVVLKVRTSLNAADAGLPVNAGNVPTVLAFPATPPTSVIVNAASSTALGLTIAFI